MKQDLWRFQSIKIDVKWNIEIESRIKISIRKFIQGSRDISSQIKGNRANDTFDGFLFAVDGW